MRLLMMVLIFAVSVSAQAEDVVNSEQAPAATAAVNEEAIAVKTEEKAVDNRKESEIPLNLEAKKNAGADGGSFFRILLSLSLLGVVGTGAFIFLRKYSVPKALKHQTQIKVLQQHFLGPKKSLAIVRVAGESILIGVTDHNISMIKSLSLLDDEVPEETPQNFDSMIEDFEDEEIPKKTKRSAKDIDTDEEFAISGIKDIVSKRLKGMRSFQ
ncbi:Flagellar biosynthesis protein, FliO [compost metagenome]